MVIALFLALLAAEPPRVQTARERSMPQIRKLFAGREYPPRRVLLRAFKQEREL